MLKILGIDWETSIGAGVHGSDPKDPSNDIYTAIAGDRPDNVHVKHFPTGCNRITGIDYTKYDLLVVHNASFDIAYIWHDPKFQEFLQNGGRIWCTAQAEYFLSAQRHKYPSLAELQLKYLKEKTKESRISRLFKAGIGADKIIAAKQTHKRVWGLYNRYAKDDVVSMLKVFSLQYRAVKAAGMMNIITMHQKALLAVIMMHTNGMKLDLIRCENTLRDFKIKSIKYLKEATDLVRHMWDERLGEFNVNSPKQKSAMLFGGNFKIKVRQEAGLYKNGNVKYKTVEEDLYIHGFRLPLNLTSESKIDGRFSTDNKVLNDIASKSDNTLAREYCLLQKQAMLYGKMCSTYLEPFLKFNVNGVLYPKFNTTQTISGRLSGKEPNLQNIPASGDMSDAIQGCLVAPEGWICLSVDFSQLEPFVTALISGDQKLTQDLLNGVCLHCRAVSWIPRLSEGKTYEEIYQLAVVEKHPDWVLKRKKAKGINFKRAYGGGAKSLAEAEDLDIEDVKAVFAGQEEEYNQHARFLKDIYENLGNNEKVSRSIDYATSDRRGMKFNNGLELLPIFEKGSTDAQYQVDEYRKYSIYTEMTGRKYSFLQTGQIDKWGRLHKRYSTTETRNYFIQGCLNSCTKIFTRKGMFEIKDLVNQDIEVWTKKGYSKAICLDAGLKKEYSLELKDGNSIKCSPSHKFLCVNPARLEEKWLTAEEIKKKVEQGKRVAVRNGDEVDFNSEVEFYSTIKRVGNGSIYTSFNKIKDKRVLGCILGRLASDGCIRKGRSVTWLFAEHEESVEEILLPYLNFLGLVTTRSKTNNTQWVRSHTINRASLADEVPDIKRTVPKECWLDKELLAGYLSGMFDGDGTVCKQKIPSLTFGKQLHKIEWAKEIQLALRLFGIRSRLRHYSSDRTVVQVMKADAPIFRDKIGFINDIKQSKLTDAGTVRKRHNISYIKSVVDSGNYVKMYDICNSEDSMFCANGLVTHNTAADVMQMASCELFDYCLKNKDVKLVRQIHDEAGFYVKKDTASIHIPKICAIMSSTREHFKKYLGMTIPFDFRVEAKVGTNFANLGVYYD